MAGKLRESGITGARLESRVNGKLKRFAKLEYIDETDIPLFNTENSEIGIYKKYRKHLTPEEYEMVVQRFVEGKKYKELAKEFSFASPSGAHKYLLKILEKLKKSIERKAS